MALDYIKDTDTDNELMNKYLTSQHGPMELFLPFQPLLHNGCCRVYSPLCGMVYVDLLIINKYILFLIIILFLLLLGFFPHYQQGILVLRVLKIYKSSRKL